MSRFETAFFAGLLGACIAHAMGVPWWREWQPGDAADIGILTALTVHAFIGAMRVKVTVNNYARSDSEEAASEKS